jgi:hypothetical protein
MRTREREFVLTRPADATATPSQHEKTVLDAASPGANVRVLPIVHDIPGRRNGFHKRADIAFIGGYSHLPNVDAVTHFLDHIWPTIRVALPDISFHALGADMPTTLSGRQDPGFVAVGYVEQLQPCWSGSG